MFKLGDVVRLKNGWTPMVVVYINEAQTMLRAKYANHPDWNPVIFEDYGSRPTNLYHSTANTYTRPFSGFVPWTGAPISEENFIMPTFYRSIQDSKIFGEYRAHTSSGDVIIEDSDGNVRILDPDDAELDIPTTFRVKLISGNRNYSAHYKVPEGALIQLNDLLMSDSGNLYRVEEYDTKQQNSRGVFKGKRILTMPL